MPISRRGFLACAAGVSASALAGVSQWSYRSPQVSKPLSGCALVDPGSACALQESSAGYEVALTDAKIAFKRISIESLQPSRKVIFPAVTSIKRPDLARLKACLQKGSMVILESGVAFSNLRDSDFYRRFIESEFGISFHEPIRIWESAGVSRRAPYIDYVWPVVAKVRDFSRVIPVDCNHGETIAWFQKMPVAVKSPVGNGTLVFLGSPLGPHLLAGDREAGNWVVAFCSSC